MSSQWKRNSPEKPNAGSWTRGWIKSPEKDTTSSAVMCATLPYWSDPFRKSKEVSLYYSLSDKTYMLQLQLLQQAKLLHIIRRKKTSSKNNILIIKCINTSIVLGQISFQHPSCINTLKIMQEQVLNYFQYLFLHNFFYNFFLYNSCSCKFSNC